jgi:hypothetical protein
MKYQLFFFLFFGLFSRLIYSQDWNGKYLSVSGKYKLVIDYVDQEDEMLSFEILDFKNSSRIESSIAFFKDNLAVTHSLHVKNECVTKLSYSKEGVFVSDFCGGDKIITGFYKKTNDFMLASLQVLPLANQ